MVLYINLDNASFQEWIRYNLMVGNFSLRKIEALWNETYFFDFFFQGKISKIVRVLELKSSIFQISWSNYLNCLVVSSHFKTVVCNIIQKTFCEVEVAKNGKFGSCLLGQNIYIAKGGNKLARSSLEGEKSKIKSLH